MAGPLAADDDFDVLVAGAAATDLDSFHLVVARNEGLLVLLAAFDASIGHGPGEEPDRFDGVIVGRNRVVHGIRVAVGVADRHGRDAQLVRLGQCDPLARGVDDEDCFGDAAHFADSCEVPEQLLTSLLQPQHLFLLEPLHRAFGQHGIEIVNGLDGLLDSLVVGEHAAQPTVGHVGHFRPNCFVGNHFPCLVLGAHEEHLVAAGRHAGNVLQRLTEQRVGLLQVDDVDPVLGTVDVRLHFGVPTPGLVPEMGAGF